MKEGRETETSLMKREKVQGRERIHAEHLDVSKGTTFVILINHASAPIKKERLSPTSKSRREASRNQFMEKGGMPDRVESFGVINSRDNRPRVLPGLVKPIRNGPRKVQNLIKCRPARTETGLTERENGIGFQKEQ